MFRRIAIIAKQTKLYPIVQRIPNYTTIYTSDNKDDALMSTAHWSHADVLFVVEGAYGDVSTVDFILEIKRMNPSLRVVYFSGELNTENPDIIYKINELIDVGVYDIYSGRKISEEVIARELNNPKSYADVKRLVDIKRENDKQMNSIPHDFGSGYRNVIIVSSIKPGSGKSFVSTNLAVGIAKYGKKKKDGSVPKVAIIDGDLQTLSVGTLLGIEDSRLNLTTALRAVMGVLNNKGDIVGDSGQIEDCREFVKKCFLPSKNIPNLFGLVGSQLQFKDMAGIRPYHFFYMVQLIIDEFDVIIIDSNSSLEHKTTGPILQLAGFCFYVLDLDFVSVRANLRHRQELTRLGIINKVSYVLNKAITKDNAYMFSEKLEYGAENLEGDGFRVVAKLPMVDPTIMLNRLHNKTPIILDESIDTVPIRIELTQIAEKIWPMGNIGELRIKLDEYHKHQRKHKK